MTAALLKANQHLRATVFDLPAGLAETKAYLKGQGVDDRCELVSGSFFDSVPSGHDEYVLKQIIHDWSDQKACRDPGHLPQGDGKRLATHLGGAGCASYGGRVR